ncbi:MAG: terminase [Hyphomicrobiales bacterium]|nr:MAG: terminase [Hyphomicrobiales bacterium]
MSNFYNGNENLPKAGTLKNLSDFQMKELQKCMEDPIYFAETYFRIVAPGRGLIPFKLYKYQKKAIRKYKKTGKLIMATARQVGKTAVATVIILHDAIFNEHYKVGILANRKATAKEVLSRIQLAYEYLPGWLKGGIKSFNKESMEFENGSMIYADATIGNSVRGKSLDMVYIDEAAFVDNWDDFASAVLPTLSAGPNPRLILTSTPNGLNHFYYYVENAKKGLNGFEYIEVPWWKVKARDEKWKQNTLAELNFDEQKFAQEQEVEFIGSSGTLISGAALKLLMYRTPYQQDTHMCQYYESQSDHNYVLVADVSRGKGLDYSAFQIIDISTVPYKEVCTYRNNMITPSDFADICYRMGTYYNEAQILVEINDLGQQVADIIWEYEGNIICTETKGRNGKQVSYGGKADRGIRTTTGVKAVGCAMIKLLIEQNKIEIIDKITIDELKTFSAKGKSYEAESGKHDDTTMCLVLFAWLANSGFIDQINDENILQHLKEQTEEDMDSSLLPFGIIIDGHDEEQHLEEITLDYNW